MQTVIAGQLNTVFADLLDKTTGSPIETGSVNFYLMAVTGTYAGKWWRDSDDSWQGTEVVAKLVAYDDVWPSGHRGNGQWAASIDARVWSAGTRYRLYAVSIGTDNIVAGDDIDCPAIEEVVTPTIWTPSGEAIISPAYVTNADADSYFSLRLHVDAWDQASNTDRTKALAMATQDIDHLDFTNQKLEEDQVLEFPRGDQVEVPLDIKIACCEIALARLEGDDPDEMLETLDMASESFSVVKATYDRKAFPEHIANSIVSATAWRYLRPYLRVAGNIKLERIS